METGSEGGTVPALGVWSREGRRKLAEGNPPQFLLDFGSQRGMNRVVERRSRDCSAYAALAPTQPSLSSLFFLFFLFHFSSSHRCSPLLRVGLDRMTE
jgi:hypothetical protein